MKTNNKNLTRPKLYIFVSGKIEFIHLSISLTYYYYYYDYFETTSKYVLTSISSETSFTIYSSIRNTNGKNIDRDPNASIVFSTFNEEKYKKNYK